MFSARKIFLSASKGMMQWIERPRLPATFFAAVLLCALCEGVYITQVAKAGKTLGAFEPFLAILCDFRLTLLVMIATLLVHMDAPFFDSNDALIIHRLGRFNWALGRIVYIGIACFLLPFALSMLASLLVSPFTFLYNNWSPAAVTLSQNSFAYFQQTTTGHYFPPVIGWNIISTMKPMTAFLWTCTLLGLLNAAITMWTMLISMSYNRIIGTAIGIAIILLGPSFAQLAQWNPYINGVLSLHMLTDSYMTAGAPTLFFSVIYFLILIFAGMALMLVRVMRHSFKWGE